MALDFKAAKLSETELKAAYSLGANSLTDGVTPLDNVQEEVMQRLLSYLCKYFLDCGEFIDALPVEYSFNPSDTLTNIVAQICSVAMEQGLVVGVDDDKDEVVSNVIYL